jgi:hypothetical protein
MFNMLKLFKLYLEYFRPMLNVFKLYKLYFEYYFLWPRLYFPLNGISERGQRMMSQYLTAVWVSPNAQIGVRVDEPSPEAEGSSRRWSEARLPVRPSPESIASRPRTSEKMPSTDGFRILVKRDSRELRMDSMHRSIYLGSKLPFGISFELVYSASNKGTT